MSTLVEKAQHILNEKNTKIIPANIKKDIQIFNTTGTYEGEVPAIYNIQNCKAVIGYGGGGALFSNKNIFEYNDKTYYIFADETTFNNLQLGSVNICKNWVDILIKFSSVTFDELKTLNESEDQNRFINSLTFEYPNTYSKEFNNIRNHTNYFHNLSLYNMTDDIDYGSFGIYSSPEMDNEWEVLLSNRSLAFKVLEETDVETGNVLFNLIELNNFIGWGNTIFMYNFLSPLPCRIEVPVITTSNFMDKNLQYLSDITGSFLDILVKKDIEDYKIILNNDYNDGAIMNLWQDVISCLLVDPDTGEINYSSNYPEIYIPGVLKVTIDKNLGDLHETINIYNLKYNYQIIITNSSTEESPNYNLDFIDLN